MHQINLFHSPFGEIFTLVREKFPKYKYDFRKHHVSLIDDEYDQAGFIRLPLHLTVDRELQVQDEEAIVLYLTIEAGNAALCLQQGKQTVLHTTFSSYMSRKKQGFSQIKYLNKKGKSRAGSRVRLAKTLEFFEYINSKLTEIVENHDPKRIAINCTPVLLPYLHQSRVPCPFDKNDERLYKIPLHIPQSNYTHLLKAIKKLMAPVLFYPPERDDIIQNDFQKLSTRQK